MWRPRTAAHWRYCTFGSIGIASGLWVGWVTCRYPAQLLALAVFWTWISGVALLQRKTWEDR